MEKPMNVTINSRESNTLLAALRYWQDFVRQNGTMPTMHAETATAGGTEEAMTDEEIDDLCAKVNDAL